MFCIDMEFSPSRWQGTRVDTLPFTWQDSSNPWGLGPINGRSNTLWNEITNPTHLPWALALWVTELKLDVKDQCPTLSDLSPLCSTQPLLGNLSKTFKRILSVKGVPPPPTPLTENQCEKKKDFFLSGIGGYPLPPLNGQNPLKRFWQVPLRLHNWKVRS